LKHLATIVVAHGLVVVGHVAVGSLHLDPERILGLQMDALQELHGEPPPGKVLRLQNLDLHHLNLQLVAHL